LAGKVLLADFFTHEFGGRVFDVIYERTFLCSLPPDVWPKYALRMAELLRPGGRPIGFFFYGQEDEPVADSLPLFAGRERGQVWEKNERVLRRSGTQI
jgi:hypothetical protein